MHTSLMTPFSKDTKVNDLVTLKLKIVAAFRGMHVSPAKHSSASVTDRQTDGQTTDKVIPMCRYALQATQKRLFGLCCRRGHSVSQTHLHFLRLENYQVYFHIPVFSTPKDMLI